MSTSDRSIRERAPVSPMTLPPLQPGPLREGIRNPGMPLDLEWVQAQRVNRSAVERRASTLGTRRTVKKAWQAGWLLRAVT